MRNVIWFLLLTSILVSGCKTVKQKRKLAQIQSDVFKEQIFDVIQEGEEVKDFILRMVDAKSCVEMDTLIEREYRNMRKSKNDSWSRYSKELEKYVSKKSVFSVISSDRRREKRYRKLSKLGIMSSKEGVFGRGSYPTKKEFVSQWQPIRDRVCQSECEPCSAIEHYNRANEQAFDVGMCFDSVSVEDVFTESFFSSLPRTPCDNIKLKVEKKSDGRGMYFSIYYNNPTENCVAGGKLDRVGYESGSYGLPRDLNVYLNTFFQRIKDIGYLDFEVDIDIVGVADGQQLTSIPFLGYVQPDISNLTVTSESFRYLQEYTATTCGVSRDIYKHFKQNESNISSNMELAYLRAFPIKVLADAEFPNASTDIYVVEDDEIGSEYRRIEVYVLLSNMDVLVESKGMESDNIWLQRLKYCRSTNE